MIILKLFRIMRLLSKNSILLFISKKTNIKIFFLINLIFAPISTIFNLFQNQNKLLYKMNDVFVELGPIFIKFGQTLSTRPDLIGQELTDQLKHLQDKIPPFPGKIAKNIISTELNVNIEEIFEFFDETPIASASVAQVHKAKLKDGNVVAVKVLRPDIRSKYESDIYLLEKLAKLLCFFSSKHNRLKPLEVVNIFKKTMYNEINLTREASACSELSDNLSDDKDVIIPKIFWDYTSEKVLTISWINDSISIYDKEKIAEKNIDCKALSRNLAILFFNQAYRDGYFHADLHPGNILVTSEGKIALVDFGIMGRLEDIDRIAIAEILHSFLNRDYKKVAEIHVKAGYVPKDCDIMSFAQACRAVAEPILHKQTKDISIGKLLTRLFQITEEFGMQTQPQLLLLQKTMVVVEGIGKLLHENVNMWELAEPWIEEWAKYNISLDGKIIRIIKNFLKSLDPL